MKILVVDDEPLARERLLRLLKKLQPDADCLQAGDGEQALAVIAAQQPDLLLLDIRMPGMSGIDLAVKLDAVEQPPAVIFCTAYDEYALQALQHQAVAYLLKPVREAELGSALDNAGRLNRLQLASLASLSDTSLSGDQPGADRRTHLSSPGHRGFETIAVEEIRCLLAEQKYVVACSPGRELLIPDTLKELEHEFGDLFVRVHRNALVARAYIIRLQREESGPWSVLLDGVSQRPVVSRRHLGSVKQRLADS